MSTFEITRTYQATKRQLFEAWTKAEHLKSWWVPRGFNIYISKLEAQEGGMFHYHLITEDEIYQMWGRFIFSEIIEPERISFINSFSDNYGNIARAPFSETWPLEINNELIFTEENGETRLTLRVTPVNAPESDLKTFEENFESLTHGFTGTFDRLEEYLIRLKEI